MLLIIFRSRLRADASEGYSEMLAEMLATAREMPGFIDVKSFTADDGERLTVVRWQDHETLAAWRNHPRHRLAQANGRSKWYESYQIEIAEVVRQNAFNRMKSPQPSSADMTSS